MSVRRWPSYLITRLPDALREAIEADAEESYTSMSEVMRQILCAHYELRCESVDRFGGPKPQGSDRFVLRVQPELFRAIKRDAEKSGTVMRTLMIDVLEAHYATEAAA